MAVALSLSLFTAQIAFTCPDQHPYREMTNNNTGRPFHAEHHSPAELPVQTTNSDLHHQDLPPKHLQ